MKKILFILISICAIFCISCNKDTKQYTDDFNRKVMVKKDIHRIVCLSPGICEILCDFNLQSSLVGKSDFCNYPASINNVETVGGIYSASPNSIAELKPDLVICSSIFPITSIKELEKQGIAVLVFKDNNTIEGKYKTITLLGEIFSKQDVATSLINKEKTTLTKINMSKNSVKPTVYYVAGFGDKMDLTVNRNTLIGEILEKAGGDNIAKDDNDMIFSQEELTKKQPQYIFIRQEDYDKFIITSPYSQLDAVKNNHIYAIDANILNSLSFRNTEAIQYISKIIHQK
jgi:iron complex transport system substrate-binding protein